MTWKYGIMKDLHGFGVRGRLPNFISNFLKDIFQSLPQGSILSVTLFSVKINSITQYLKPGIDCSVYVDDFQICYRLSNISIIEHQMQLCLNKLQQWATDNSFQFSKTKTVHLDPQHFLDKSPIPVMVETKFWGLYLTGSYPLYPILSMLKNET